MHIHNNYRINESLIRKQSIPVLCPYTVSYNADFTAFQTSQSQPSIDLTLLSSFYNNISKYIQGIPQVRTSYIIVNKLSSGTEIVQNIDNVYILF